MYTSAEKGSGPAFQPVLYNVFYFLISLQTLAAETFLDVEKQVIITWCMAAETFLDVEKQVIITWCKVRTVRKMLENVALVLFEVLACKGGSMRSRTVL